jgi:hypothetical protein
MTSNNPTSKNGCDHCGCTTPRSRLCKQCADANRGDHVAGGDGDGDGDTYECVGCGTTFVPQSGLDPCPDCNSLRHIRVEVAD